jgi:flagellar biosynthesis/type III secretory pathway protein FliH
MCEKLICKELTTSPDAIINIISQALKSIESSSKEIRIICHKKLYDFLISSKIESQSYIVYEIDNHLSDFQFKIESDTQKLTYNVEQTLNQILEDL